MKRAEAEATLVGKRVSVWTQTNGEYVGILVRVTGDRPWRAEVRIEGVLGCGVHWERGGTIFARGKEVGDIIEVGGSSVARLDGPSTGYPTYAEAIDAKADEFERRYAAHAAAIESGVEPHDAKWVAWMGDAAPRYRAVAAFRRAVAPFDAVTAAAGGREFMETAVCTLAADGKLHPSIRSLDRIPAGPCTRKPDGRPGKTLRITAGASGWRRC